MNRSAFILMLSCCGLYACATPTGEGTLAELDQVRPDVEEVYLEDSLDQAAESYRRYLEETSVSGRTPEASGRTSAGYCRIRRAAFRTGTRGSGTGSLASRRCRRPAGNPVADRSDSGCRNCVVADSAVSFTRRFNCC